MGEDTTWMGGVRELGRAADGSELHVVLLYDADNDKVVGSQVVPSAGDVAFGAFFAATCEQPAWGRPRVPRTLRVDDPALALAVGEVRPGVRVAVSDTPELDGVIDHFIRSLVGHDDDERRPPATSFLGRPWSGGPPQKKRLEPLGARLLTAAPWRRVDEATPIRVSAPRHGLPEGVVGVFGVRGESPGFSIYHSVKDLAAFVRASETTTEHELPAPLGAPLVTFALTPRKRGQPEALVLHVEPDWAAFEADRNELALAIAVAEALVKLGRADTVTHEGVTLVVDGGGEVVPITRAKAGGAGAAGPPARRPQRNDPCWCGSGKKYKKCHLDQDAGEPGEGAAATGASPPGRTRWGPMMDRMVPRAVAWCHKKVPGFEAHLAAVARVSAPVLAHSHAIFALPVTPQAEVPGELFRREAGAGFTPEERQWLDANLDAAWTSYWTVVDVEPGRSLTLRDLFSEEVRTVVEASASRMVAPGSLVCARVVTVSGPGGESYMDAVDGRVLGPKEALVLRESVAVEAGLTKRKAVPVAALRAPKVVVALLVCWQIAAKERERAWSEMSFTNTDGERLMFVEERFALGAPRERLVAGLATLEHLERDGGVEAWALTRPGNARVSSLPSTNLASLVLERDALVVTTNSRERADRVAAALRAHLGDALGPSEREESDAKAVTSEAARRAPGPDLHEVPAPEVQAAVRATKASFYASWPDEPIPALDGKTPRQAVKTVGGKQEVEALIADMERHDYRDVPGARFDFDELRRALALPPRSGA